MKKIIALFLTLLLIPACSEEFSDDGFLLGNSDNYINLMERGWEAFQLGNFDAAITFFQTAADRDATKAEPYLGLGWSYARATVMDLEVALSNLSKVPSFAPDNQVMINESYAGTAVINYALLNYETAIEFIDRILADNPDFQMQFDASINAESLNAIRLNSHFNLNNVSTVFTDLKLQGLPFNTVLYQTEVINVAVTDANLGIHQGSVTLVSDAAGLIKVRHVAAAIGVDTLAYAVTGIDEGSNTFTITGNPVIPAGADVYVYFDYAQNYGSFINELLEHLSNQ